MIVAPVFLSVGIALLLQASTSGHAAHEFARQEADSGKASLARQHPDSARAAIARLLALSVLETADSARARTLSDARSLARAYAVAWQDSLFVRQIALFERWNVDQRITKVAADSLRRAGNDALGRAGVPSALRLWRSSLRLATTLDDSAGQAAALGNIGAGLYRAGSFDSATTALTRSHDLASIIGDYRSAGNALGLLASISKDRRDYARAEALYTRAAKIRARSGDTRGLAADQNNLGLIALSLGDLDVARRAFDSALVINRRDHRDEAAAVNLTNLAAIASTNADFPQARVLYNEALDIYRSGGFRASAVSVLHSMGRLQMRRGDYEQARIALVEASSLADSTGAALVAIAIRADLATVYAAMGKLQAARILLRDSERHALSLGAGPTLRAALALASGDLAVEVNDLPEAERRYSRAAALSGDAGDAAGQAAAHQGQGHLLLLRDDDAGAAQRFALAARAYAAVGDGRSAALARMLLGYALAQQGDTVGGRRTLEAAARELHRVGDVVGEAATMSALGDLSVRGGAALAAEAIYRQGLDILAGLPAPNVRWQLHAGLGEALRSRGALADAARETRSAVAQIERMSSSLRLEDRRFGFLADKWDVFAQLALTERARGRNGEAFAASERMRARQMLDLLARGRIALVAGGRDSATVREQDLRQRISTLTRDLERDGTGRRALREPSLDSRALNPTREALDAAQKSYAALLLELRESNPAYARLVNGETATWREIAAKLASDEVLLDYLTTDSATIVFVITRDTIDAIELDVSRRALTSLIDFTRGTISRSGNSLPGAMWRSPLRRLGQLLIAPVQAAGLLDGKRELIIVPHGSLHFLPFQALLLDSAPDRFLVERFQVTYAPSASLWLRLSEGRRPATSNDILAFAPRTDALPASRGEVETIATIYGDRASVLIGAAASEQAFRVLAPTKSIVHLATYGVLNKHNPLFSFIELAPEGKEDGRLEVRELFSLTLNVRLLVLSACQTALGSGALADIPAGDDWVGLVQGFLQAGAAKVMATLWSVEDRATATLMRSFYRELSAGRSESAALAEAQRAALRNPRTAHPFYWAGFVLSGGR